MSWKGSLWDWLSMTCNDSLELVRVIPWIQPVLLPTVVNNQDTSNTNLSQRSELEISMEPTIPDHILQVVSKGPWIPGHDAIQAVLSGNSRQFHSGNSGDISNSGSKANSEPEAKLVGRVWSTRSTSIGVESEGVAYCEADWQCLSLCLAF